MILFFINTTHGVESIKSAKKIDFICPDCGSILNKSIQEVTNKGLNCDKCSDNISYPNKFSRALLAMLYVKNIDYELQPG